MAIDWVVVKGLGGREIGAVGFIGNKASIVESFYDDADGNMDGEVSWGEWIASKISPIGIGGMAVTRVAMAGRYQMDILTRDASFNTMAMNLYLNFANRLLADGVYAVYFSRGVGSVAKSIAGRAATGMVKQFVIRKGMQKAVKEAYKAGVGY